MAYSNKLPKGHVLFFLEEVIENLLGLATKAHDAEHASMMRHWGLKYANFAPLDGKLNVDEDADDINAPKYTYKKDRQYHLSLHVKFWDEVNNNIDIVERYKALASQGKVPHLSEIELPEIHQLDPKGK